MSFSRAVKICLTKLVPYLWAVTEMTLLMSFHTSSSAAIQSVDGMTSCETLLGQRNTVEKLEQAIRKELDEPTIWDAEFFSALASYYLGNSKSSGAISSSDPFFKELALRLTNLSPLPNTVSVLPPPRPGYSPKFGNFVMTNDYAVDVRKQVVHVLKRIQKNEPWAEQELARLAVDDHDESVRRQAWFAVNQVEISLPGFQDPPPPAGTFADLMRRIIGRNKRNAFKEFLVLSPVKQEFLKRLDNPTILDADFFSVLAKRYLGDSHSGGVISSSDPFFKELALRLTNLSPLPGAVGGFARTNDYAVDVRMQVVRVLKRIQKSEPWAKQELARISRSDFDLSVRLAAGAN